MSDGRPVASAQRQMSTSFTYYNIKIIKLKGLQEGVGTACRPFSGDVITNIPGRIPKDSTLQAHLSEASRAKTP